MNITYAKIKKITKPFFQTANRSGLLKHADENKIYVKIWHGNIQI